MQVQCSPRMSKDDAFGRADSTHIYKNEVCACISKKLQQGLLACSWSLPAATHTKHDPHSSAYGVHCSLCVRATADLGASSAVCYHMIQYIHTDIGAPTMISSMENDRC